MRCILFREDVRETNKKLMKIGITVTKNDIVVNSDNTPTTIHNKPSLQLEKTSAWVSFLPLVITTLEWLRNNTEWQRFYFSSF